MKSSFDSMTSNDYTKSSPLTRRFTSRPRVHLPNLLEAQNLLFPQNIGEKHEWSTFFLVPTASSATVIVVLLSVVIARRRHLQHDNRLNFKLISLQSIRNGWFPIQKLFVPFVNEIDIRCDGNFRLDGENFRTKVENSKTLECTYLLSVNHHLRLLTRSTRYWLRFLMFCFD